MELNSSQSCLRKKSRLSEFWTREPELSVAKLLSSLTKPFGTDIWWEIVQTALWNHYLICDWIAVDEIQSSCTGREIRIFLSPNFFHDSRGPLVTSICQFQSQSLRVMGYYRGEYDCTGGVCCEGGPKNRCTHRHIINLQADRIRNIDYVGQLSLLPHIFSFRRRHLKLS